MIKYGALFTCARCGAKKFAVQEYPMATVETPATWSDLPGKEHLCPTCTDLYNKMMNNFFAPEVKRPINLED